MASVSTVHCTTDVTSGGHETRCHNLQREVRTTSPVKIDCIGLGVHIGYSGKCDLEARVIATARVRSTSPQVRDVGEGDRSVATMCVSEQRSVITVDVLPMCWIVDLTTAKHFVLWQVTGEVKQRQRMNHLKIPNLRNQFSLTL